MQNQRDNESLVTEPKKRGIDWRSIDDFIVKVALPAALIILLVNVLFDSGQTNDLKQELSNTVSAGQERAAYDLLKQLIEQDFYNLQHHRDLLRYQYEISTPKYPVPIQPTYETYTQSNDPNTVDIGYYGLGFYHSLRRQFEQALPFFEKVQNRELIYLNNSIGYCYFEQGDLQKAVDYFHREIDLNGYAPGAYSNLAKLYLKQRNYEALDKLLQQEEKARIYVPWHVRRYMLFCQGHHYSYVLETLSMDSVTFSGFIAACAILAAWMIYLRKLDPFEPELIRSLLLILFAGMAFSMLCSFLYDFVHFGIGYERHQNALADFIYCIAGVGLIEETVKIIPFLLMLKFSKQINESVDYIIYPAVSALGFAFMENLFKFGWDDLSPITSRYLSAAIMHMALSSIAAYGLFYAKYKKQNRHRVFYFSVSFITACFAHGLYDYWLIFPSEKALRIFSVLILMYMTIMFGNMIRNALNHSEFLDVDKMRIKGLTRHLVYSISYIFLLQYFLFGWKYGSARANQLWPGLVGYILLLMIYLTLGVIEIDRGKWIGLMASRRRSKKK